MVGVFGARLGGFLSQRLEDRVSGTSLYIIEVDPAPSVTFYALTGILTIFFRPQPTPRHQGSLIMGSLVEILLISGVKTTWLILLASGYD